MTGRARNVFSIPAGVPFLGELVDALLQGRLVDGVGPASDPLALADVTIYLPTRRAVRELRAIFMDRLGGRAAILPSIRALGEFDEDEWAFEAEGGDLATPPPVAELDRILALAPLVQGWKRRLPAHLAGLYEEELVVPASLSDAIWLARDLAALMDEIETEGADWTRLADLVPAELAGWWQVTLEFLQIVTTHWPDHLAATGRSNPATHRTARIDAERRRLAGRAGGKPVIAAGSTGSIPATAALLSTIAGLPQGAVVLPGLDLAMDDAAWRLIGGPDAAPSVHGHPQAALKKLMAVLGVDRREVRELATADMAIAGRIALAGEALRPAETTEAWATERARIEAALQAGALDRVSFLEAANEREEALAIAVALRLAIAGEGRHAALVTGDRDLARRVSAELARFGIIADDSAGTRLADTAGGILLALAVETALRPGDPVALMSLLKHPLLGVGMQRAAVRRATETIDLVALRGGTGRPDIAGLSAAYAARLAALDAEKRQPFWLKRLDATRRGQAGLVADAIATAAHPLTAIRGVREIPIREIAALTVEVLEALAVTDEGLAALYDGDAGDRLAAFLRSLVAAETELTLPAADWPDVLGALMAAETVKPTPAGDPRVSIWGTLEARLQHVDTIVLGGLNEGSWPRRAEPDRFMSRMMKSGLDLDPPERRIGQAAHDFVMAFGNPEVVLSRALRSGEAPAVASRWLQRLITCAGEDAAGSMRSRGAELIGWARRLDDADDVAFAPRPEPRPPLVARPTRFSVTEIETLRRDPYAFYARHVLDLHPVEPLLRDPGAAERGNLFHEILHKFCEAEHDPHDPDAAARLVDIGGRLFDAAGLLLDLRAVWWPRFARMADEYVAWERGRIGVKERHTETVATAHPIGVGTATLRGRADRIDVLAGGMVEVLDFKTGYSPSKGQAHTLLAPQLALEAALVMKGAFATVGRRTPSRLSYIRLKANGDVTEESILSFNRQDRSAVELADDAWGRLEQIVAHYGNEDAGYKSRAVPFREGDTSGDYDHLARVLEWSAGTDEDGEGEA